MTAIIRVSSETGATTEQHEAVTEAVM